MPENGYTVREVLDGIVIPRIDAMERSLERLEQMSNEGSPYGELQVRIANQKIDELKVSIADIKQALLTPDNVSRLIADSLQKTEARGWTHRERWMGVGLFLMATVGLFFNAVQLWQG